MDKEFVQNAEIQNDSSCRYFNNFKTNRVKKSQSTKFKGIDEVDWINGYREIYKVKDC